MKTSTLLFQPVYPKSQAIHIQSDQLSFCTAAIGASPLISQRKSLVRIEMTTVWSSVEENIGKKKVFYRKPLLTHEGRLDKEKLVLEILSRLH